MIFGTADEPLAAFQQASQEEKSEEKGGLSTPTARGDVASPRPFTVEFPPPPGSRSEQVRLTGPVESKQLLALVGIGGHTAEFRLKLQEVGIVEDLLSDLVRLRDELTAIKEAEHWINTPATLSVRAVWTDRARLERKEAVVRRNRILKSLCGDRRLFDLGRLVHKLNHTHDEVVGGGEFVFDPEF